MRLADGDQLDLRIAAIAQPIGDTVVRMLAYNGSIPGPTLRVRQGSEIVVHVTNDGDVEATVRVRYENGKTGTSTRRLAMADVPEAVRADLEKKGSTRVFRTWAFPWQRVHAL